MIVEIIELSYRFLAEWSWDKSVEAERKRQAKSFLKSGQEILWQGRFDEADARFGAARRLNPKVISTLSSRQRTTLNLELGNSGKYGINSREFWRQLNPGAKR